MKTDQPNRGKIFLGSVEPSYGSMGLDIPAFLLQEAGFQVERAATDLDTRDFSEIISRQDLHAIGLSLTTEGSKHKLKTFILRNAGKIKVPLIIGGLFANPFLAKYLSEQHDLRVYYNRDGDNVVKTLFRALSGQKPDPPETGRAWPLNSWPELEEIAQRVDLSFLEGPLDLLAFREDPRLGCPDCPSNIDKTCPLASGYSTVREIESCRSFINSFEKAVLMVAPAVLAIEGNHRKNKDFWYVSLKIEDIFRKQYGRAFAFRFPLKCPICPPGKCTMPDRRCSYPKLLRPLHEEYCIDMAKTSFNMAGDRKKMEIFALMLVGEK